MVAKSKYTYDYPRPALTVDAVVFGVMHDELVVLLVRRAHAPFAGMWAIPGGFVEMGESTDDAVQRELKEETGLENIFFEQLYTFSAPDRDPRERVVSVSHLALVSPAKLELVAGSDASAAMWIPVDNLPPLAFDHAKVLKVALDRLRGKVRYQPIGFELLPKMFTLGELQSLYEAILGRELDKRNFRRKVLAQKVLRELPVVDGSRGAKLYAFDRRAYNRLLKSGFNFEI